MFAMFVSCPRCSSMGVAKKAKRVTRRVVTECVSLCVGEVLDDANSATSLKDHMRDS